MEKFDLETPLLEMPDRDGVTAWTMRDAVEGVQIFGGIGSGKTSGSGRTLALKFLLHGFGGLVLTAKPDEKELWQEYCRITNRLDDLIVLEPGGPYRFNFLEYESSQTEAGVSLTGNIVQVLKTVIRSNEEKNGGRSDDAFWQNALDLLMYNTIDLCKLAYGKVSVQNMYDIATTAPKKEEIEKPKDDKVKEEEKVTPYQAAFKLALQRIVEEANAWFETLTHSVQESLQDPEAYSRAVIELIPNARLFHSIAQFFSETYRNLSDKTRATIEFSFTGVLFHFLQEPFYSLFCRYASNVTPESCLEGKIILINLPVKLYYSVGRDCQILFKYIWQRAMERRDVRKNERPVFLWADEAQHFLHEHDAEYQATARSSRIATVYLSQNLPNYLGSMGGAKAEHKVNSFLGTLGTKFFHANADIQTNQYSASLIGKAFVEDTTRTLTVSGTFSAGKSTSLKLEEMVRPEEFVTLKTGGPLNNFIVQAYVHHQGKPFHNGLSFIKAAFNQI